MTRISKQRPVYADIRHSRADSYAVSFIIPRFSPGAATGLIEVAKEP